MWDFYLAGSEAAFRAGGMMVFQIQLAKDQTRCRSPATTWSRRRTTFRAEHEAPESLRLAGE